MKPKLRHKAIHHLCAMQETGTHYSIHLVTDVRTIKLTRFLRRFFIKQLGHRPDYHLFWMSTNQGTMVCVSGDKTIHRIMDEFYKEAINLKHCSTVHQVYVGASKNGLANAIALGILHYESKGDRARSLGGSAISPTAAVRANEAIKNEAMTAFNRGLRQ